MRENFMRRLFMLCLLTLGLMFAGAKIMAPQVALAGVEGGAAVLFKPDNVWLNTSRAPVAADAKGRLVLLDFWTYGCINCMQIVPDLKALEMEFGDKLLVIGVHSAKFAGERGSERIAAAAKRFGITHPVINDSKFDVWDAFNVNAWPTLILLDGTTGHEINRYAGEGHKSEIEEDIRKNLPGAGAAPLAGLKVKDDASSLLSFPSRLGFATGTPWGDVMFVADSGHNRLLGFDLAGHVKVTIGNGAEGHVNGSFAEARFNHPRGFGVSPQGLYVADTGNHMIRYIDFKSGKVSTVAGTGRQGQDRSVSREDALDANLASPWDAKLLPDGKTLVIAMAGLHQLWAMDIPKQKISRLAGSGKEDIVDGDAADAALAQPSGLSPSGDTIYFVDAESSSLRSLRDGKVQTLIGTGLFDFGTADGAYPKALLQHAQGLDADAGRIVVADTYNNALRIFDLKTKMLSTVKLPKDALQEPGDVLQVNGKIYVADTNDNRIVMVDDKAGSATPLALKQ